MIKFAAGDLPGLPGARRSAPAPPRPKVGRQLTVPPREVHDAQLAARATQDTPSWQAHYARRAGVEGTIRQAVAVTGMRRARYRGLPKTQPRARLLRGRAQPDPPGRLLERARAGPDQDQPPHPPRTRTGRLIELASRVSAIGQTPTEVERPAFGLVDHARRAYVIFTPVGGLRRCHEICRRWRPNSLGGRAARERVRLQAAEMFEQQLPTGEIAARLRVSTKSVCVWRRAWLASGRAGPASRRLGGANKSFDHAQLDRLTDELESNGGAGLGRLDQRPAVGPGPGRRTDPPPVRRRLHPARGVVSAAPDRLDPAGPDPPRGRA